MSEYAIKKNYRLHCVNGGDNFKVEYDTSMPGEITIYRNNDRVYVNISQVLALRDFLNELFRDGAK